MASAQSRGWGDPDAPGYRQRNIVTIRAGGIALAVHREVAPLFESFCDEIVARGYRLDGVADDWGYANRDVRGRPGVKSNHSWGLAIDINATTNPMTARHPDHANQPGHDGRGTHTDMPRWVVECAERHGLYWGGNYGSSRADAMHFEFLGTPDDARRAVAGLGTSRPTSHTQEDEMSPDERRILTETYNAVQLLVRTEDDEEKILEAKVLPALADITARLDRLEKASGRQPRSAGSTP